MVTSYLRERRRDLDHRWFCSSLQHITVPLGLYSGRDNCDEAESSDSQITNINVAVQQNSTYPD